MPGPMFHVGGGAQCMHGGQVTVIPSQVRVLVSGQPVAVMADRCMVAGCAFTVPPGKPQPCVTAEWQVPTLSKRVFVGGQPVVLLDSIGVGISAEQARQATVTVTATTARVVAS
jgi:hypothetical protein